MGPGERLGVAGDPGARGIEGGEPLGQPGPQGADVAVVEGGLAPGTSRLLEEMFQFLNTVFCNG